MKKLSLLVLLSFMVVAVMSQNNIFLLQNNTKIEFVKQLKLKKGLLYYKEDKKSKEFKTLKVEDIDYLIFKGKYYGICPKNLVKVNSSFFTDEKEKKGALDACRFYNKYKGAMWGTWTATFLTGGIVGLVPAIITSSTPPQEKNLNIPDSPLKNDPVYLNSYKLQAKKMKSSSVWLGGYLGGVLDAISLGIVIGVLSM
jgi:hypothetical protein